jgi:hypothetical protein
MTESGTLDFNSQEEIPIDRELLDKLCEYGEIEIIHNGVHYYAGGDHTIFVQTEENFKVGIQSDIQINIHRNTVVGCEQNNLIM